MIIRFPDEALLIPDRVIEVLNITGAVYIGDFLIACRERFREFLNDSCANAVGRELTIAILDGNHHYGDPVPAEVYEKNPSVKRVLDAYKAGFEQDRSSFRVWATREAVVILSPAPRRRTEDDELELLRQHAKIYFTYPDRAALRLQVVRDCVRDLNALRGETAPGPWTDSRVRRWLDNHRKEFVHPGRADQRSPAATRCMRLALELRAAAEEAERQGERLTDLVRECEDLRLTVDELRMRLKVSEEAIETLLAENEELRSELEESRVTIEEIIAGVLPDVAVAQEECPEGEWQHLKMFLDEWLKLAAVPLNRRRYSERMYELAFILHRDSPVAYDVLRQILALPTRSCLQDHFKEVMEAQIRKMTNPAEAERVVREYIAEKHVRPDRMHAVLACDATSLNANGNWDGGGYCFAFGVLFFDPDVPDLWLHIAKRDTGSLGQVEAIESELIAACERAGLKIVFAATDGDRVADKRHTAAFRMYRDWVQTMTLAEIVERLELEEAAGQRVVFHRFPISDFLHLIKNLRGRIRNHTMALTHDAPPLDAATFADLLRPPVVSIPGQSGSMSDLLAKELFTPQVLAGAFECGNTTAPLFIGPWTFIATALECQTLTVDARLELLSVAFATLAQIYETARKHEYPEQGSSRVTILISTRNHLRRSLNLCLALFYAIKNFAGALLLGRFGTHSVENHFGIVRSALHGQGQWRLWCGAEAFAAMLRDMKAKLGLADRGRCGRSPIAGTVVLVDGQLQKSSLPAWSEPDSDDRTFLLEAARLSVYCTDVDVQLGARQVMWEYTCRIIDHLADHPIKVDAAPSPAAGHSVEGRYFSPPPQRSW
jgi:hypothetical protein